MKNHRYLLPFLFLLLLLVACGGADAPLATPSLPVLAPTAVVTVALPPTAAPTVTVETTATAEPSPTAAPTATVEPTPLAPTTAAFPALVWLPYATGSYGNPLPTLRGEQMGMEPEPTPIEHFFGYSPLTGQLAYGRVFWTAAANGTDSVTDLWVYEYATGETTQWLAGGVGRAAWSPVAAENGAVPLAIALHNGQSFDLALVTAPDSVEILATNIAPYFAWSPDGRQMAYLDREGNLFTAALPITGMVETLWASGVYANGGWIGDAPVWDLPHNLLIYADEPFTVVNMRTGKPSAPLCLRMWPPHGRLFCCGRPIPANWLPKKRACLATACAFTS